MAKFKKGFVTGVKKERAYEEKQDSLHEKHHITDKKIVVVEKDNMTKFTIRSIAKLVRLAATIVLCILAAIGLLTLIYPELRSGLLLVIIQIYSDARTLMGT